MPLDSEIVHSDRKPLRDSCKSPICARGRLRLTDWGPEGTSSEADPARQHLHGRNGSACRSFRAERRSSQILGLLLKERVQRPH